MNARITAQTLANVLKGQQIIRAKRRASHDVYSLANGCLVVDYHADEHPVVRVYADYADFAAGIASETFEPDEC
jgi:hypothetical protein